MGCVTSKSGATSLQQKIDESRVYMAYSEEAIIYDEQPFPIQGDKLKDILHRSVGALTFLNKHKKIGAGSGVLISKDIVLTAAHNIFDQKYNVENLGFKFYLGANGIGEDYHEFEAWRYPVEFKICSPSSKLPFDYAIMKLKRPVQFDKYLSLSLICQKCVLENNKTTMLKIFGFPCTYPPVAGDLLGQVRSFQGNFRAFDEYGTRIKLYQYGLARQHRIVMIDALQSKIGYGISTLPGQSGCPVVMNNSVIAIHVGGDKANFNVGRIIDEALITSIRDWAGQLNVSSFNIDDENICQHVKPNLLNFKKSSNQNSIKRIEKDKERIVELIKPTLEKQNPATRLDLSRHNMQSINLSGKGHLLELNLSYNMLASIDVRNCPFLTKLEL